MGGHDVIDETTHSRDRDYPSHMVPKLITLPYELETQNTLDGNGSRSNNVMPKRKKTTPRMAHYHYFYELYKQKMHY